MPRSMRIPAAFVLVALAISACGDRTASVAPAVPTPSPSPSALSTNAPPDQAVTLRVANGEGPGSPESNAVLYFAADVARRSAGTVKVDPVDDEQGDADNDNRVASGEIDAAITQARSWDALGVTSLQALQTPFLVTNEATAAAATDGDIATRLMSGLMAKGVDGLALWAIDFRHPVSFGEPFLTLADFRGAKIRIVGSTITEQVITALGAEAVRPEGEWLDQIKDGTIKGAETAFDRVGTLPQVGTMTGNVTFYPRVDAFFINHAVFGRLSAAQQAAVRDAAAATRQHILDGIAADAEQAAGYCSTNGGTVVLAGDADLSAIAAALAPVRAKLEADPLTKQLIAAISAAASGIQAPPATVACAPPPPDVLQGTWHTTPVKEAQIMAAFVAAGGPEAEGRAFFAQLGGGATKSAVLGVGFDQGSFTQFEAGDSGKDAVGDRGSYALEADGRVTLTFTDCTIVLATTIEGDVLRLKAIDGCTGAHNWPYALTLFATFPFHRDPAAAVPDGTYTAIATKADAIRIPWDDPCALKSDGGHIALELDAGTWTESERCAGQPSSVGSHGTYTSTADAFVMTDCCDGSSSTFSWRMASGKLTLKLVKVTGGDESTMRVIRFIFEHVFDRG